MYLIGVIREDIFVDGGGCFLEGMGEITERKGLSTILAVKEDGLVLVSQGGYRGIV